MACGIPSGNASRVMPLPCRFSAWLRRRHHRQMGATVVGMVARSVAASYVVQPLVGRAGQELWVSVEEIGDRRDVLLLVRANPRHLQDAAKLRLSHTVSFERGVVELLRGQPVTP